MSKPAKANGRPKSSLAGTPKARSKLLSRLRASEKALRSSLRALKRTRDAYQRAVYDWAEAELAKVDLETLAATREGLPLAAFIGELEKEIDKS